MIIDYNKLLQENIKIKIDQTDLYNLRKYKMFKNMFKKKQRCFSIFQDDKFLEDIADSLIFIEKKLKKRSNKIETILNYLDIDSALKLVFKKDIKIEKEIIKLINQNKKLKQQLKTYETTKTLQSTSFYR